VLLENTNYISGNQFRLYPV